MAFEIGWESTDSSPLSKQLKSYRIEKGGPCFYLSKC